MFPDGENLVINLSDQELKRLESDRDVNKIFHEKLKPLPLFVVVLSKKKYSKQDFKNIIEAGDSATSILLKDSDIESLKNNLENVMKFGFKTFDVFISTEQAEAYNKIQKQEEA